MEKEVLRKIQRLNLRGFQTVCDCGIENIVITNYAEGSSLYDALESMDEYGE